MSGCEARGTVGSMEIWIKVELEGDPPIGVATSERSPRDQPDAMPFVGFLGLLHALTALMARGRSYVFLRDP